MAHGHIINVSPGGVLTIWSREHGRYRFFAAPLADLKLLDGLAVEFEPEQNRDLSKISIIYGERLTDDAATPPMFAFLARIGELISGGTDSRKPADGMIESGDMVAIGPEASFEVERGDAAALTRLITSLEH